MRETLLKQLNQSVAEGYAKKLESALYAPLELKPDSDLSYHKHVVRKGSRLYMTGLDILGIEIDGKPIAGVYNYNGQLIGFK